MGKTLQVNADTDVWAVLLSKELGLHTGVDDTVAVALKRFAVRRRDRKQVGAYLTAVLERVVAGPDSQLPFRAVRWQRLDELPVILFFGSLSREVGADAFLVEEGRDDLIAPVVVDDVDAGAGTTIRRSLAQSQQEQGTLTGLRYVVDTGEPDLLGAVHSVDTAERIGEALADTDAFARAMHFVSGSQVNPR